MLLKISQMSHVMFMKLLYVKYVNVLSQRTTLKVSEKPVCSETLKGSSKKRFQFLLNLTLI